MDSILMVSLSSHGDPIMISRKSNHILSFFNNCKLRKKRADYLMKVEEVIFNSCLNKNNRRVCYSRLRDCSNCNTICISLTNSRNDLLCIKSWTSSNVSLRDSINHISFSVLNSLSQYLYSIYIILPLQRLNVGKCIYKKCAWTM